MEYAKRVGKATFLAGVTHGERGDWRIVAGAYRATLPMTYDEAEAWVAAGKPLDPPALPARIVDFLGKVARPSVRATGVPRVHYAPTEWVPLDGEESVRVIAIEKRMITYGAPGEVVTARVHCDSPRCRDGANRWLVVQLPGSNYDTVRLTPEGMTRIENVSPHDFAAQHMVWHAETFPASPRVLLDKWIERNKDVAAPELSKAERAEIDLGIAIARSEK